MGGGPYSIEKKSFDKKLDLTRIKPYGDTMNDGKVQLSFTLPVDHDDKAIEAAKELAEKMGLKNPEVLKVAKKISYRTDSSMKNNQGLIYIDNGHKTMRIKTPRFVYGHHRNPISQQSLIENHHDAPIRAGADQPPKALQEAQNSLWDSIVAERLLKGL